MLFSFTRHAWSNRSQGDKGIVNTTADKKRLNLTKRLLTCPELTAINDAMNGVYVWALGRSMQSDAVRKGIYFVKRDMVPIFEDRLTAVVKELNESLIPAFIAAYPAAKEAMKLPAENGGLGDLYVEGDYPAPEQLRRAFSIQWAWLALSVPDELPDEVRTREITKLRESFEQAQEEIKFALRESFQQVVAHAIECLTPNPDGTPKMFRASSVNFDGFFETFHAKSMVDDNELIALVDRAREIIRGMPDPARLRKSTTLRAQTAAQFAEVNHILDDLVSDKPNRMFCFD